MKYSTNQEVLQDIQLVFENCYTYNQKDTEEFQCATRLEKYLSKEAKKFGFVYESVTVTDNKKDDAQGQSTQTVLNTLIENLKY